MSEIYYLTLRERYSPKPAPKCSVCGEEMSIQRISGAHVVYGCSGYGDDGDFKIGRTLADEHYEKSRVTVVDDSDPDVIALLDEMDKRQQHIRRLEQENVEMALTLEKLRVELETVKQREKDLFMENVRLKSGIAGLIHLGIRYADVEVMKIAGDAQLSTPCTDSIINSIASGVFTKEGQHDENSRSSR
ncbi:TPA: ead/Ea22-like family protein [Escherichia coli]|nr:ead/Ea22-like family protein [Escherichia coli]